MGELFAMKTPSEELTKEGLQSLEYPKIVQPKLDGVRGLWVNDQFFSFSGKPFWNIPHLTRTLPKGRVFDGELVGQGMSMAETNGILKAKSRPEYAETKGRKIQFHVFDMLTLREWDEKKCQRPLHIRQREMERVMRVGGDHIRIVPSHWCDTAASAFSMHQIIRGEGIMLKDPNGLYHWRRHESWLRFKPDWTEDFRIVGYTEGVGKWSGSLGAFQVEDPVTKVLTFVGGGRIDKATRDQWWKRRQALVSKGVQVEIAFKCRTKDGHLREPRLLRLREDK